MPYYRYTAIDKTGKRVSGVLEADNESQIIDLLKKRQYAVLKVQQVSTKRERILFGISLAELVIFSRQLSTMVGAGVRIKDALAILSNQLVFSSRFRKIINHLVVSLETGSTFSEALRNERVFDSIFINLVSAGEEGGVLDKSLEKAADFYEASKRLQDEVKSAMAYPIFVLIFAIGVIFIISFYILPRLIGAFGSIPTSGIVSFLMNVNGFLSRHWLGSLITAALIAVGLIIFMKTRFSMYLKELLATLFPPAAKLRNMMGIERFCRTLSVLTGSGVLLTKAVEMAAAASNNPRLVKRSKLVSDRVKEGASLRQAMIEAGLFPQIVYELVGTGEETGKLEEVLAKVADFYEDQVRVGVKKLVSLIEPMLIAGVGGFIAFMAFTMYSTIFQLQQTIGR
ncbi:type II secretion system F family protein [Pseudothermotoga sp. U03pept]|uniref:type II secretion system F family protein n=1 Tax=Pseudothermotoga sp. U03pept TaxID=3447012 RepID=UPI003F0E6BF0